MRLWIRATIIGFSLVTMACSSSGSGDLSQSVRPVKPLSKTESDRLKTALSSIGEVMGLTNELQPSKQSHKPNTRFADLFRVAVLEGTGQIHAGPSDLKKAIDENDCEVKTSLPDGKESLQAGDMKLGLFKIEVVGAGCPLRYSATLTGQEKDQSFHADLTLSYEALSEEAKKLGDVTQMTYTGRIEVKVLPLPQGQEILMHLAFVGNGLSQNEGAFKADQSLNGKISISFTGGQPTISMATRSEPNEGSPFPGLKIEGEMIEAYRFDFKELAALLTSTMRLKGLAPEEEYLINNQKVSAEEYKSYRDSLKMPGIEQGGLPGGPVEPERSVLSCSASVYSSAQLSLERATQAAAMGIEPMVPALRSISSCNQSQIHSTTIGDLQVEFDFDFQPGFARVAAKGCKEGLCQTTERFFIPDETKAYAEEQGGHIYFIRCESKPSCGVF